MLFISIVNFTNLRNFFGVVMHVAFHCLEHGTSTSIVATNPSVCRLAVRELLAQQRKTVHPMDNPVSDF